MFHPDSIDSPAADGRARRQRLLGALAAVLALGAGLLWVGYRMGSNAGGAAAEAAFSRQELREALEAQRRELERDRSRTRAHLDALAQRLGLLQSRIMRLDALGEQLVRVGGLDAEEFRFAQAPAQGGLDSPDSALPLELVDLVQEMEQLSRSIEERAWKLDLLEDVLVTDRVRSMIRPSGRPVKGGWISSPYGYRKDPFTGKKDFHHGVDIAGREGSSVFAVASGVVTWAGRKGGYGYLVEIRHADGLTTRYGHNREIFVRTGDLVEKGQEIGLMGSSGRSTGPHVHFEIARGDKSIDPSRFFR